MITQKDIRRPYQLLKEFDGLEVLIAVRLFDLASRSYGRHTLFRSYSSSFIHQLDCLIVYDSRGDVIASVRPERYVYSVLLCMDERFSSGEMYRSERLFSEGALDLLGELRRALYKNIYFRPEATEEYRLLVELTRYRSIPRDEVLEIISGQLAQLPLSTEQEDS